MSINYTERIPNNVDLGSNRILQRALEHWQPEFLNWWQELQTLPLSQFRGHFPYRHAVFEPNCAVDSG